MRASTVSLCKPYERPVSKFHYILETPAAWRTESFAAIAGHMERRWSAQDSSPCYLFRPTSAFRAFFSFFCFAVSFGQLGDWLSHFLLFVRHRIISILQAQRRSQGYGSARRSIILAQAGNLAGFRGYAVLASGATSSFAPSLKQRERTWRKTKIPTKNTAARRKKSAKPRRSVKESACAKSLPSPPSRRQARRKRSNSFHDGAST